MDWLGSLLSIGVISITFWPEDFGKYCAKIKRGCDKEMDEKS